VEAVEYAIDTMSAFSAKPANPDAAVIKWVLRRI